MQQCLEQWTFSLGWSNFHTSGPLTSRSVIPSHGSEGRQMKGCPMAAAHGEEKAEFTRVQGMMLREDGGLTSCINCDLSLHSRSAFLPTMISRSFSKDNGTINV